MTSHNPKDRQLMMYRGQLVSTKMSKQQLIEIIAELGQQLEETQGRATHYLKAVTKPELLMEKKS